MAQTKPKAGQFYGVSDNGTDGQFLKTDGTGGMSWDSPITNPTITSIDYPGSTTAADPAGGQSVIINGTLFASGITCTVGGTSAVTAFNSATQITITTPAKAAGPYTVAVLNPDGGTASQANFIQYSGVPVWSTAAGTLGNVLEGAAASFQVTATEGSDTIEYAVTTGTLPTGLSLATATGAITGTAGSVSADTTTTFSITATDDENQTSSERSFSITVQNDVPSNYFTPVIWTGNGSSRSITSLNFEPDLVWIKDRSATRNNCLFDTVRGPATNLDILYSDITNAQDTNVGSGFLSDTTSNGFNLGNSVYVNGSGNNYVAWCFKAGGEPTATNSGSAGGAPTSGSVMINGVASTAALAGNVVAKKMSVNTSLDFSIVDFTSVAGSTNQVPHGLSGTPDLFIFKRTDAAQDWYVYTEVIDGSLDYLVLNSAAAKSDSSETAPTATTVYQPTSTGSRDYILYSFKSKPGFSKIGSYTGTGAQGNNILLDFEPAFVMIKCSSGSGTNWVIVDNKRDNGDAWLYPNAADAEFDDANLYTRFYTNGFSVNGTASYVNTVNATYIYLAFAADGSTATPSLANSFNTTLYNGSSNTPLNVNGIGFEADFSWLKVRNNSWSHGLFSSLMPSGVNNGVKSLYSNRTDAATDLWGTLTWNNNGWTLNGGSYDGSSAHDFGAPPYNYVSWNWKAGGTPSINTDGSITSLVSANQAAGFSISKYNHTTTSGTFSVGHGLGAAPELVIFKCLVTGNSSWLVYYALDETKLLVLDANGAASSSGQYWPTSPSSSVFNFGTDWATYFSYYGGSSIMYSFKSISGYSKVGTYTGLGSGGPLTVNMGFAPTLGIIKRTDSTGGWRMFDTVRGTDKSLRANSSDAEYDDSANYMDFTSTGFYFSNSQTNSDINAAGGTYIYLAIKEN
jgi:hypothetical protein